MKVLSATFVKDDLEVFTEWKMVDKVIRENMPTDIWDTCWKFSGYEGLFDFVPEHFGMTRMYRSSDDQAVTFEFTDAEWTMFVLRWA